jgi:hypothetical protein
MRPARLARAIVAIVTALTACGPSAAPPPIAASNQAPRSPSSASGSASASARLPVPVPAASSSAAETAVDPDVLVPSNDPTSTFRRGPAPAVSSDPDQIFQREEGPSEVTLSMAAGTPDAKLVLGRNRWRFRACHVQLLKTSPEAAGTLKLKLQLAADGKVDTATPAGGTAPAELAACARAQAKQLRFAPPTDDDAAEVIVVLVFTRKP